MPTWNPTTQSYVNGPAPTDSAGDIADRSTLVSRRNAARLVNGNELDTLMPKRGVKVSAIGDSILYAASTPGLHTGQSFVTMWCALSGGRFVLWHNRGVGGNTTTQMLARFDADILSTQSDWCLVLGGTNDLAANNLSLTIKNLVAMWDGLRAALVKPIAGLLPPSTTYAARVPKFNAAIRLEAEKRGIPVADLYTPTVDPANGQYKAGMSADGVHPNGVGSLAIATYLNTNLTGTIFNTVATPVVQMNTAEHNMITNGLFLTGTGGVATGWTNAGVEVPTLVADAAIQGQWQSLQRTTATGLQYFYQVITAGYSENDLLEFSIRVDVASLGGSFNGKIGVDVTTVGNQKAGIFTVTEPFTGIIRTRMVVPVGATNVRPIISLASAGTGTIRVAQATLVNLTTLGVA